MSLDGEGLKKTYSNEEKKQFVEKYLTSELTLSKFCLENDLKESALKDWRAKYNKMKETGIDTFHEGRGAPPLLDNETVNHLAETVSSAQAKQNCYKSKQFPKLVCDEVVATAKRRNISITCDKVDPKTLRTYKEKTKIEDVSGQTKTSARVKAESDPRNNLTMGSMLKGYTEDLNPHLKMNLDFTQFYIEEETRTILVVKNGLLGENLPATSINEASFGISIKYLHLHDALGLLAPAVFILADDTLGEHDCKIHIIKGASGVNSNVICGYLVIMKSRTPNHEFYRFLFTTIIIPFCSSCLNDVRELIDDEDEPLYCFLTYDGENEQIAALDDNALKQEILDNHIVIAKSPASCSATLQPSDVSGFFKGVKAALKSLATECYHDPILEGNFNKVFKILTHPKIVRERSDSLARRNQRTTSRKLATPQSSSAASNSSPPAKRARKNSSSN